MNISKGPWTYNDNYVVDADRRVIAYINPGLRAEGKQSEADANGCAIAALPDLIFALDVLLKRRTPPEGGDASISFAHVALAKANGE